MKFTKQLREFERAKGLDSDEENQLRNDILSLGKRMKMEAFDPRIRLAWQLFCRCPGLLRPIYPLIAWER